MKKEIKAEKYNPSVIEQKWQAKWLKEKTYQPDLDNAKKPFFNLMMFPYPSAEGMHVGNMYAFTGSDIYGRFKRMRGHDVLEPIGLDGFGIHSENYAIKVGNHPVEQAKKSEENFYRQLRATGNSFDWGRTVETYDPEYYKWTQWLFITLFKAGLAYRKKAPVNFCPSCKTVLADEQVIDGKCERCSSEVEKRELEQWFFRITTYAERLLNSLEKMDWTEKVKIAQRNWIGKKTGINISYQIENSTDKIICFTTRPDTNFGATFIVIGPEHPMIEELVVSDQKNQVIEYVRKTLKLSTQERNRQGRKKTGVFTGSYAINNLNGKRLPIWVSDFVIGDVGTGAVVGVPGHDIRDFQFAQEFSLPIIRVVVTSDNDTSPIEKPEQVQEAEGTVINSEFLDGLPILEAKEKIMDYLVEKGWGEKVTTYHLRDWLISRQRYWGPPIPMIYCGHCASRGKSWFNTQVNLEKRSKSSEISNLQFPIYNENPKNQKSNEEWSSDGWYPVQEDELPVKLPYIEDFKPLGTGESPLGNHPEFYKTTCPECGNEAKRETDVSDTFLDSAWYFLRYISTELNDMPFPSGAFNKSEKLDGRLKKWVPVHMYIGGAEHSVLHLLYARFIWKVLSDLGFIQFSGKAHSDAEEPFARFYAHGLLIKEGAKMSKSKGNVIIPDDYIKKYGADTLRTYLMFLGPFNAGGDFYDSGIEGIYKFLKRVWVLATEKKIFSDNLDPSAISFMNKVIKTASEEMEGLRYNTAIAQLMTYYNYLSKKDKLYQIELETFLKLLAPFAPHITEELWNKIHTDKELISTDREKTHKWESIHTQPWPVFDPKLTEAQEVNMAIQVNGKVRAIIKVETSKAANEEQMKMLALGNTKLFAYVNAKKIKKVIFVAGKIINFVI